MPVFENDIEQVRGFNRFYTKQIGLLREGLLKTPFSLTQARVLYELGRHPGTRRSHRGDRDRTRSRRIRRPNLRKGIPGRSLRSGAFQESRDQREECDMTRVSATRQTPCASKRSGGEMALISMTPRLYQSGRGRLLPRIGRVGAETRQWRSGQIS